MIAFTVPLVNGELVDKWRVEWSLDSQFSFILTQSNVTVMTYYNITGLKQGVEYYIRVTAHNSLGYGSPSLSYPFIPVQQPGVVSAVYLTPSYDALALVDIVW